MVSVIVHFCGGGGGAVGSLRVRHWAEGLVPVSSQQPMSDADHMAHPRPGAHTDLGNMAKVGNLRQIYSATVPGSGDFRYEVIGGSPANFYVALTFVDKNGNGSRAWCMLLDI